MIAITAYEAGELTAAALVALALFAWMTVWLRRERRMWWIPAVLATVATLMFVGRLVGALDEVEPSAAPPSPVRSIDPESVFVFTGYRLERLDDATQAQLNDAATDPLDALERATGRRVFPLGGDDDTPPIGSVLVYAFRPAVAARPAVFDEFMRGLTQDQPDAVPSTAEVAGTEVRRVGWPDPDTGRLEFVVWQEENLIIVAGAGTADDAEAIAEAVITR